MLHFNGTNGTNGTIGSTSFTDSSPYNKTITIHSGTLTNSSDNIEAGFGNGDSIEIDQTGNDFWELSVMNSHLKLVSKLVVWVEAQFFGDCEDYALRKRQMFIDSGCDINDIWLVTCFTETNEYHCVLMVNTTKGYKILDNRYALPYDPLSVDYKWDKALTIDGWRTLCF